jgi:hypothetical protein
VITFSLRKRKYSPQRIKKSLPQEEKDSPWGRENSLQGSVKKISLGE